jgi:hypothetical protein
MVGRNFDVTVQLQNKSRLKRTVHVTLTCSSVHYTGVLKAKLRTDEQLVELSCIKGTERMIKNFVFDEHRSNLTCNYMTVFH